MLQCNLFLQAAGRSEGCVGLPLRNVQQGDNKCNKDPLQQPGANYFLAVEESSEDSVAALSLFSQRPKSSYHYRVLLQIF